MILNVFCELAELRCALRGEDLRAGVFLKRNIVLQDTMLHRGDCVACGPGALCTADAVVRFGHAERTSSSAFGQALRHNAVRTRPAPLEAGEQFEVRNIKLTAMRTHASSTCVWPLVRYCGSGSATNGRWRKRRGCLTGKSSAVFVGVSRDEALGTRRYSMGSAHAVVSFCAATSTSESLATSKESNVQQRRGHHFCSIGHHITCQKTIFVSLKERRRLQPPWQVRDHHFRTDSS